MRTLDGARDPFLAGTTLTLAWDARVDVTFPVADRYTSTMKGWLRRVRPTAGQVPSNLILARTWLAAPATFASSSSYFRQDYEVEVLGSSGRVASFTPTACGAT